MDDKDNKRINKNKNNNKTSYEFNENEFPSLANVNNKDEEDDNVTSEAAAATTTTTVTILTENQKKLIKNVNFLKQQVELFYRNDIEERELKSDYNSKQAKLSFKEALEKEKPRDLVKVNNDKTEIKSRSRASSNDMAASKCENNDEEATVIRSGKKKKRGKKNKNKTKENEDANTSEINVNSKQEFKLNDDDFPGLNEDNARSGYSSSSKNVSDLLNLISLK